MTRSTTSRKRQQPSAPGPEQASDVPPTAVVNPTREAAALPETVSIGSLSDQRLVLRQPLLVQVQQEDGLVSVWNDGLGEFGSGKGLADALEDFQQTVAALYFTLRDNVDRLGPLMRQHWEFAQQAIDERR